MTFHIGQKVVCVNDHYDHPGWDYVPNKPVKGGVYTIRQIGELWHDDKNGGFLEFGFATIRFKPVEYKAMSIFRAIAANPKLPIKEMA